LDKIDFDLVFSSPPFGDLELYNGQTAASLKEITTEVLVPLITSCRKRAPVCLYIPSSMAELLAENGVNSTEEYFYKGGGNKKAQVYKIYVFLP
jgi:hypothetical protein